MRAVVFHEGHCEVRDDIPEPRPALGECTVEVLLAGVCATDLALRRGYMGFRGVPGHEFVGRALDGPLAGQRVVGEINAGCGTCVGCREGDPRHCSERSVLGIVARPGAFADRLALPIANLLAVPENIDDLRAVFTEPLAAALEISAQLPNLHGTSVMVAGDGRLGLLCAWAAHEARARVVVAGRHPERHSLLPEGVEHRLGAIEDSPCESRRTFDVAIEATGSPTTLPRLLRWVRPRGTIVLKTTTERPITLDLAPFVVDEITLVGSRCGRFDRALRFLREHPEMPLDRFVDTTLPLTEIETALERSARSEVVKVLVDPRAGR